MGAQIIEIAGQKMAMLPIADYERLLDIAEDKADVATAMQAQQRRDTGEEYVPMELADKIMAGESALRVWRKHRGRTLKELAAMTGHNQSKLSKLETGAQQGKPSLWRALASALDVSVDDILPVG